MFPAFLGGCKPADYDEHTLLMCHFDGSNGSTTITDSVGRHTLTAYGNAQISTAQAKFKQSLLLDGTGDYVSAPNSNDFKIASDYTIEFWTYIKSHKANENNLGEEGGTPLQAVGGKVALADTYWAFGSDENGKITIYWWSGSANAIRGTTTISLNTWTHLAFVRRSNNAYLYLNGQQDATGAMSSITDNLDPLLIGASYTYAFDGHNDELRISDVARWTSNFTPPSSPYS